MSDIFISYHKTSGKDFARELKRKVQAASLTAWLDDDELILGDDWKPVIDHAIKQCSVMVVVVTLGALTSQYVTYEWSFALGVGKRVIPLFLEFPDPKNKKHPPIHPKLQPLQFGNFTEPDETSWEQLLNMLVDLMKQEEMPSELQSAALSLQSIDPRTRFGAIEFMLKHESKHSVAKILKKGVQSRSPDISADSGIALARLTEDKDEDAIPGLIKATRSVLREAEALGALVLMDTESAINALFEELNNPLTGNGSHKIMVALAQFQNRAVIRVLTEILLSFPYGRIPIEVLEALAKFKEPESLPGLVHILRTPEFENLKPKTIQIIGDIGRPEALEPLYDAFKRHMSGSKRRDNEICDCVLGAIKDIGGEDALKILEHARVQNDPHFRRYKILIDDTIRQVKQRLNLR